MDVIAAIATGSAATAIGIVRVSGDGCFALCGRVFRAAGGRPFAAQEPRKMVFGEMLDRAGRVIDRGLAVRFHASTVSTGMPILMAHVVVDKDLTMEDAATILTHLQDCLREPPR